MLVKTVDLPKFDIEVDVKNAYNRKKIVQTGIKYSPVSITFHDDNQGLTTQLWAAYYQYYFADGTYSSVDSAGNPVDTSVAFDRFNSYKSSGQYRYGLDNDSYEPFFTSIQISQMSRGKYTTMTLVNPMINSWHHDTMDYSAGAETASSTMQISYESVFYADGLIDPGNAPKSFGDSSHYDNGTSLLDDANFSQISSSEENLTLSDMGLNIRLGNIGIDLSLDIQLESLASSETLLDQALSGISDVSFPSISDIAQTVAQPLISKEDFRSFSSQRVVDHLTSNPEDLDSLSSKVYSLGLVSDTVQSFGEAVQEYQDFTDDVRQQIQNDVIDMVGSGNAKVNNLANELVSKAKKRFL